MVFDCHSPNPCPRNSATAWGLRQCHVLTANYVELDAWTHRLRKSQHSLGRLARFAPLRRRLRRANGCADGMPVYEEKLISPLAVRFSQDRVRTTFRNGQSLEEVIELVKVKEVGDKSSAEPFHPYDVILQPPFSNIEVVRWGPRKLRVNGSCGISLPGDEMHWYTNCNQRLYVLQRVAAKYWPKKVACEVDVLFTVPNELLKTYDSSTAGLLAALSESAHCESASVWNWGRAVTNSNGKMDMALERAAMKQLEKDDASCTLADLVSIPHVLKTESRAEVLDDAETFAASTSSEQVMASPRIQSPELG